MVRDAWYRPTRSSRLAISPFQSRSTITIRLRTRAGASARSAAHRSRSMSRSASAIASGFVSRSDQRSSLTSDPGSPLQPPPLAPAFEQPIRLLGASRTGRILRNRRGGVLMPGGQDRIDDLPQGLDLIASREQRGVAAHGVEDQPLVGLR